MFCDGRSANRQSGQGAVPHCLACHTVLDPFCFRCSIFLFCSFSSVLAKKRLAEVGQVVSQGAPQRHAFDFVESTYGQRRQPAIGS
jgi:hypothetical protein